MRLNGEQIDPLARTPVMRTRRNGCEAIDLEFAQEKRFAA
jgi:hypothetical protein